jgi:hypothetical protein
MEEILKHRGQKDKDHHQHHHHMHLFHLPGHHHHKDQQQQTVTVEKYREVSSAIDDPGNSANSSSSHVKLTVGRIE